VEGRPTLILNVETAAHLAQVLRWGPDWFRSLGTQAHPGTALVTVSGPVASPGVHEIPLGTSLSEVAATAGGLRARPQAVLVGGYFGAWLPATTHDVGLCEEQLRPLGAAVGCGALAFLPAGACGLRQSAAVLGWMQGETAGQCGPCVHGLAALAGELARLADGSGDEGSVARLQRWAGQVEGRGACRLPDGAVRFLRSVLAVFDEDVRRHQAGAPCPPGPLLLPVPVSGTLSG
jgi:NADH:ubiquinone oxidoreductase subunit F (NADH-binding)